MKQAVIYARVSSERQEEQRTIESQLEVLRDACRRDQVLLVGEYIDDGLSGATLARPGLDQLRDDANRGLFQAVYILSPDRLARKYVYQALVLEELQKRQLQVVFLDKQVTEKPEDQLLLGMQGLIAEYERAQIIERTRRGRMYRARQGEIVSAIPPFGFNYVSRTKEKPAHYTIKESEAEVVRLIFNLYLQTVSSNLVVKELLRRKIRPRGGGQHWHPCVINKMLRSECYAGRAYYNKTRGTGSGRDRSDWILIPVPRIVDEDTFQTTQKLLDRRGGGRKVMAYLLTSLARCKYCGSKYVGNFSNHRTTTYYRCSNRYRRFPRPRNCFAKLIRAERLESAVVEAIKGVVASPEVLSGHIQALSESARNKGKTLHQEVQRLKRKQAYLEDKSRRLLDLYLEGGVAKDEYLSRKDTYEDSIGKLRTELAELQREVPLFDEEIVQMSVGHFCDLARKRLKTLGFSEMQQFLRLIIDEVSYDWQAEKATIKAHIPVGSHGQTHALFRFAGGLSPANRNNALRFELQVPV